MDRVPRLWRKSASRDPDAELQDLQQRFRAIRAKASHEKPRNVKPSVLESDNMPAETPAEALATPGPWSSPPACAVTTKNSVFRYHGTPSNSAKATTPIRGFVCASLVGGVVGFAVVALTVTFGS